MEFSSTIKNVTRYFSTVLDCPHYTTNRVYGNIIFYVSPWVSVGNMWAQQWSTILELIKIEPESESPMIDVTPEMVSNSTWNPEFMFQ